MTGKTISHYQIGEKLGEGGMGVVYKARDTSLDRYVALKLLPADKLASPERKQRFIQEAKAASALNHPHIITVHEISEEEGRAFTGFSDSAKQALLNHTWPGNVRELQNVVRNAVLHSGPDSRVEVGIRTSPGEVVLTVADTGPGVPEEDLERLFEPFYRVDPSRDHKQSGYGLGLAIAARIVERHGGKVEARNRTGGGLAVSFRLPAG